MPGATLQVRTAERAGDPAKPTEDRIFQTPEAVIVLDGASQVFKLERSGGWMADTLGRRLADGLRSDPKADLRLLLEHCIAGLVADYDLVPGKAPSATSNIVRLDGDRIDVLVLCDSPVVVADTTGRVHEVRDDRLADLAAEIRRPPGLRDMTDPQWVSHMGAYERRRNQPGGFWVASATPEAARYAVVESFKVGAVDMILAMTDGVSTGVDDYGIPATWSDAVELAAGDPDDLVELVHRAELGDADRARWHRSKVHDDKALAVVTVAE